MATNGGAVNLNCTGRRSSGSWRREMKWECGRRKGTVAPFIAKVFVGRKTARPAPLCPWAATWRKDTRAARRCHTEATRIRCGTLTARAGVEGFDGRHWRVRHSAHVSDRRRLRVILDLVEEGLNGKGTGKKKPEI